jgi:hypothetical protein
MSKPWFDSANCGIDLGCRSCPEAHYIRAANREARVFSGGEGRQPLHGMHQAVEEPEVDCTSVWLPRPPGDADRQECAEEKAYQGPQGSCAEVQPQQWQVRLRGLRDCVVSAGAP